MGNNFEWQAVTTEYRESRASSHGEELRWLVNREHIVNRDTGQIVTRAVIRHPGICVIVPFLADGRVVLMRQYRYSLDGELWELPAGTLEAREEGQRVLAAESPEAGARRELLEEAGYEAAQLEKVAECYAMPGSSDELIHLFFAVGLTKREQNLDPGEIISEVRAFSLPEIEALIERGEIRDAKTLIGLFYALRLGPRRQ